MPRRKEAEKDALIDKVAKMKYQSDQLMRGYEQRWSRNLKLMRGIPLEDKTTISKTRNRSKIYFRKIWATIWRLTAAFYTVFLRDPDQFKVVGRDTKNDPTKAKVLQGLMEYRRDKMENEQDLFLKHIWAFLDIGTNGIACGKMYWEYNSEQEIDRLRYDVYPLEQVRLDMRAQSPTDMKYVIYIDYIDKDEMKSRGYKNVEKAQASSIPSNELRNVRNAGSKDPLQNPSPNEYPKPGTYSEGGEQDFVGPVYEIWECFYKVGGVVKHCVTNRDVVVLRDEIDNPHPSSKEFPLIFGMCLTEPHKPIAEGFPEPMEGPQESFNYTLNMRKDNVAMALTPHAVVSRFANVDLNSLTNRRVAGVTLTDDPSSVAWDKPPDVTRSAYQEATADDAMMQEISGVTAQIEGLSNASTATEAQINLGQGVAKIELYTAIAAATYMKSFYIKMAKFISEYETDERVFRIVGEELGINPIQMMEYMNMDFEADIIMNVGGTAGRQQEIRDSLLLLDRGAVYNQSIVQLMQIGAVPQNGFTLFNGEQVFRDLIPKFGKKELDKYFVSVAPPPPPQEFAGMKPKGGNGNNIASLLQGRLAAQVGGQSPMGAVNDMQMMSQGGAA